MPQTSRFVNLFAAATTIFFLYALLPAQEPGLEGSWQASLASPGGPLGFGIEFLETDSGWSCFLINGPERIKIPKVSFDGQTGVIDIAHYDSRISFSISGSDGLGGEWTKRRGPDQWTKMNFQATRREPQISPADDSLLEPFIGRWRVQFKSESDPSVAVFKKQEADRVLGTFMTTTGDYRFLDGTVDGQILKLSCFDGAHAFLFHASRDPDGTLSGDFWSADSWHDTWTGKLDEKADLPDAFAATSAAQDANLGQLSFPDLDGKPTRLDDPKFAGKARLIYVFGSWCPNCHDAASYFAELQQKYEGQGLSILGLAFEVSGDFDRDAEQVRRYLERHGSSYPVLIAGISDKAEASKAVPFLDRVRSYPTTIFLDGNNRIRAVYTGFSGPATGPAFVDLKKKFESLIDQLISESR
jgi:thiol-disulfide isomerase/thioredoxin